MRRLSPSAMLCSSHFVFSVVIGLFSFITLVPNGRFMSNTTTAGQCRSCASISSGEGLGPEALGQRAEGRGQNTLSHLPSSTFSRNVHPLSASLGEIGRASCRERV